MKIIKFVSAIMALVYMTSAQALAILDVDDTGQLMGASGVEVDGALYDVQFLNGSCVELFDGCDEISDFMFQDETSAGAAAIALLEQVFLDVYDLDPELTNGVDSTSVGNVMTPYALSFLTTQVGVYQTVNWRDMETDRITKGIINDYNDPSPFGVLIWANWSLTSDKSTVVPEPGSAILLLMGLAGFTASRKLKHS